MYMHTKPGTVIRLTQITTTNWAESNRSVVQFSSSVITNNENYRTEKKELRLAVNEYVKQPAYKAV